MRKVPLTLVLICVLILYSACQSNHSVHYTQETANRAAVEASFQSWNEERGSSFDLLAEYMKWTIIGTSPSAGTFTREPFLNDVVAP
jgi:hypothetical protein